MQSCWGHQSKRVEVMSLRMSLLFLHLCVCVCVCVSLSLHAWTSGWRVLEGPVVCVNPLKASGSLLLWRFQWISATA